MKEIKVYPNHTVLVDDEDFEHINQFKWSAQPSRNTFYATRQVHIGTHFSTIRMHRQIMGFPDCQIDHKNGNGLDNRKENLRFATAKENSRNRPKYKNCKSKYKGVSWDSKKKLWRVGIVNDEKKRLYIGRFKNEEDAAKAYDTKAKELFGEFASLNFP